MDKLKEVLGLMPEGKAALGQAARERVAELKRLRKKLSSAGIEEAVSAVDHELELWTGTKEERGLMWALDVSDAQKAKEPDPLQKDISDERDYRTWDLTTDQVRELVPAEVSERPPVEAIRILNALEDGEGEKEGGSRKTVLDVIRAARKPLIAKVDRGLAVN